MCATTKDSLLLLSILILPSSLFWGKIKSQVILDYNHSISGLIVSFFYSITTKKQDIFQLFKVENFIREKINAA